MDIKDKVVLVTGASSGIGKATAELFIRKGAKVVLAARSLEEVKELAVKMPDSLAVAVDMTKPQEIQQIVQETQAFYGRIDVLINNASQELNTSMETIDVESFARLITSDVYGPLVAMQTTIPLMKQQGGGAIVNISSGVFQTARSTLLQAESAKSVLNMISLNTRTEYIGQGVSVSLVYPREPEANFQKLPKRREVTHTKRQTDVRKLDSPEAIAAKIVETIEKGIAVEFL
ncbi:MAG: SDR family NAD(P)-dependent oxidoreductase [Bacteroidota bacterium]|jgi:NADP-dependent 3-hydroxy acid dehydrogenase YdfG